MWMRFIYNAGSGTWGSVEDISVNDFDMSWRGNALGALVAAQQVIPAMKQKGGGKILFIGATASRRGGAKTAAFAPAKAAQRSLAEAMARHLWPLGIHVALVIIDGVVDPPKTRERMPDKPAEFFVKPEELADTAFHADTAKALGLVLRSRSKTVWGKLVGGRGTDGGGDLADARAGLRTEA